MLPLVGIEVAADAVFQHVIDQPAQVAGAEPGLVIQQEGAQLAAMADEGGGMEDGFIQRK
ncbi:hypothetical protein D9M69_720280 [compost metagenome]